ncbi:hypothetical protein Athai_50400 [Actinocatenispora thailandica]|uniref:Uncharacterized protein n=1 Tax=Actinocatenispora thailandica TaxID=227318 RepID=A0A7R7HYP7_9ACTN|nr:hypothetical protein [Actinocatenispora thailandica]BCJ37537.1 hypothetical protein Athai_50400 [Actinocatenispora thailandica]
MRITQYLDIEAALGSLDAILVETDVNALRAEHLAAHFVYDDEDLDLVCPAFGVQPDAVRTAYHELKNPDEWPVFRIKMSNNCSMLVIYRNFEDDPGIDFVLQFADVAREARISALEGHYLGPGLSSGEYLSLDAGIDSTSFEILLLVPIVGEAQPVNNYYEHVLSRIRQVNGDPRAAAELARQWCHHSPFWPMPTWRKLDSGVLVSDGQYSPRNPENPNALDPTLMKLVSRTLNDFSG